MVCNQKNQSNRTATALGRCFSTVVDTPYSRISNMISESNVILDLGCGAGGRVRFRKGAHPVGIDIHRPSIERAKQKGTHMDFLLADATRLPIRDQSVDGIIALDILEHLTREGGLSMIQEVKRVCRGVIALLTPNGYLPQGESEGNVYQVHLSGWSTRDLEDQGFQVTGTYGICLAGRRLVRGSGIELHISSKWLGATRFIVVALLRNLPKLSHHLLASRTSNSQTTGLDPSDI